MMTANDNELQEENVTKATVGDRWLFRAIRLTRRTLPAERWLSFAAAVYNRHGAAAERQALVQQVQERLPGASPTDGGTMPWLSQPPAPAQPMAAPQRLVGQPKPMVRTAQWQMSPAPGLEAQPGRAPAGTQSSETDEPISLPQEGPTENTAALPASVVRRPSLPLAPPVRNYLAHTLDIRIPTVRIYANQAADQVARRQQADAVASGRNILFRSGKYDPATRQGLALLGHELTHVARGEASHAAATAVALPALPAQQGRTAWQSEEAAALQNEQHVLDRLAGLPETPRLAPLAFGQSSPLPAPAPTPRAAATGRSLNEAGGREATPAAAALTAGQLQQIKDAVYRDLMDRIRTEFERGG